MPENDTTAEFQYWAFISYSHKDSEFAQWLQRSLENFVVPDDLVGKKTGRGYQVPDRLSPVFRDVSELPTSSDLSEAIHDALRDSRYLVVICSPHSAQSLWVNEEVLSFKRLGRENRILSVILDGEPNIGDKPGEDRRLECFPEALRYHLDPRGDLARNNRAEPIAADCRKQMPDGRRMEGGRERAFLKIAAGLLGVDFDHLYRRQERVKRRALVVWATASSILVAVLALLFVYAATQRDSARSANHELADLVSYMIDDLETTLEQAGRLDLLEAPLGRVEQILQRSKAASPESLGRLRLQKARIMFLRGEKSASIRELENVREQLSEEIKKHPYSHSNRVDQILQGLDSDSSGQSAVLETLAAVQTTLGDYIAYKEGRTDAARQACEDAIRIYEQLRAANPNNIRLRLGQAYAQNYLADLFGKDPETSKAIDLYRKAASLFSAGDLTPSKNGETDRLIEVTVRGRLRCASLLNRNRRFTDAIKELDSANALLQAQLKSEPKNAIALEQKSFSYRDRAWAFNMLQDPGKAGDSLAVAVQTLESLVSIEPQNDRYKRDLASVVLGDGENPNLSVDQRRTAMDRALKLCEAGQANDPTNLDWKNVYARALRVSGDWDVSQNRPMEAVNAYKQLFSLFGEDSSEEGTEFVLRVAGARVNFARALLASASEDKLKLAPTAFDELSKAEKAYDEIYSRYKDPGYLRDKAVVFDARGETYQAIGDATQARKVFFEALLLRKNLLVEAATDNRDTLTTDVVVNLERLARLDRQLQSYNDAVDYFDQAIQLQSDLVEKLPSNQDLRFGLARLYLGKAGTLQDSTRSQDALKEYSSADEELKTLLKQAPVDSDYLRELSLSYYRRGQISLDLKDAKTAAKSLEESWKIYAVILQKEDPKRRQVHVQPVTAILELKAEAEIKAEQSETAITTRQTLVETLRDLTEKNPGDKAISQGFAKAVVAYCELILNAPAFTKEHRANALSLAQEARRVLLVAYGGVPPADLYKSLEQLRNHLSTPPETKPK